MNILEHYILEVISKEPVDKRVDMLDGKEPYHLVGMYVTMRVNCYGSESVEKQFYSNESELQADLDRGYYLA